MRLRTRFVAPVVLAAAAVALGPAGPAGADVTTGGSPTERGYGVTARVTYSGSAAPGAGSGASFSVPAKCWWEPASTSGLSDPSDPEAVKDWWEKTMPTINGSFSFARVGYGDAKMYEAAIAAAAAGRPMTFYQAECRDFDDMYDFAQSVYPVGPPYSDGRGIPVTVAFFPPGEEPAPEVDPADLAQVAYDNMVLVDPVLERNPKIGGGIAATLVGLPTWFWVNDPEAVGPGGKRDIRATVEGPGGVWAQVDASTDELTISSNSKDAGTCTPAQAVVPYRPGAAEAGACTLTFTHSSAGAPGGWTVTSRVDWNALWTSSTGDGGNLNGRFADAQVQVPVAESQAVVGDVG